MIHQDSSSTTTSLFCVAWEEWDPTWHLFGDNNREALALISTDPFYDLFGVRQEGVEPADLIKACETIVLARQDRTKNPKKRPREKCTMANFQARIQDLRRKRSSLDSAVDKREGSQNKVFATFEDDKGGCLRPSIIPVTRQEPEMPAIVVSNPTAALSSVVPTTEQIKAQIKTSVASVMDKKTASAPIFAASPELFDNAFGMNNLI
ncbi:hypothetical protein BC830DRAFT_1233933 [Chytriomyces sp. MP71]|nr:hypothetical protein BC830DRAFT_1233933 [Chytriomyces sp. MP71]